VALMLKKRGIRRVRPLAGGFGGWQERAFPIEPLGYQPVVDSDTAGECSLAPE
jgi:hypothetical protein